LIIIEENKLVEFLKTIYFRYGHDFIHYNHSTLKRRIEVHCIKLSIENFDEYCKFILSHKNNFDDMFNHFSINVTEFFREPEQLKLFKQKVIPYLNSFSHIKIICAGCSSGESPYSLSIILDEAGVLNKCQIYATDFNNTVLQQAKNGIFPKDSFIQFKKDYIQSGGKEDFYKWFEINDDYVEIDSLIKNKVHFFQHNLVTDGIINEFHIVFCRNVLIYFDKKLQEKVFKLIYDSLIRNCFLILGKSETVNIEDGFKKSEKYFHNKIFQKG